MQDLQNIRLDRLGVAMETMGRVVEANDDFENRLEGISLKHIGSMEILPTKQALVKSLEMFFKLSENQQERSSGGYRLGSGGDDDGDGDGIGGN